MILKFPEGFLWGTATSAHQVEGNNNLNNWWHWEEGGGSKPREKSLSACDHFNRFDEDFALAKSLHQNTHRFSIEWSRIEPKEGEFSDSALYHYRKVLEALHRQGMKPMATLIHFTLPQWIAQKGGWENHQILFWFERYVRKCVQSFGDLVPLWITINEPMVYFFQSYVMGEWPPESTEGLKKKKVVQHQIEAHGVAYHVIHEENEKHSYKAQVGLAAYYRVFHPWNVSSPLDRFVVKLRDWVFNLLFLKAIHTGFIDFPICFHTEIPNLKGAWDFIGLNYYTREKVQFSFKHSHHLFSKHIEPINEKINDLGWEVYPEGIYEALKQLNQFQKPIYITENGICTQADRERQQFIVDHLSQVHRAIKDGVDVKGYYHWSLLDNFEWAEGYSPRFGLIHVDRNNQERIPRDSARLYAEIALTNNLEVRD